MRPYDKHYSLSFCAIRVIGALGLCALSSCAPATVWESSEWPSCVDVGDEGHFTRIVETKTTTFPATSQQCPYDGNVPATTYIMQEFRCVNGTPETIGGTLRKTEMTGTPECHDPRPCGTLASGRGTSEVVSQTRSWLPITTELCPMGGSQNVVTTVIQNYLCTNGSLEVYGPPDTDVFVAPEPSCDR